MELFMGS